jgi:hypothetical protein
MLLSEHGYLARRLWNRLGRFVLLVILGFCCLVGCGSQVAVDRSSVDLEIPEDEQEGEVPGNPPSDTRLHPGDRFGFSRRLTTVLTQPGSSEAYETRALSHLEMTIVFEGFSIPPSLIDADARVNARPGEPPARQFQLGFLRCRQIHEFPDGTREVFDSLNSPQTPTQGIVGCHGLMGNGFRFWLSERGELLAVDDFAGFLDRCSEAVPDSRGRLQFRRDLEETWGREDPTQLLHDWIGLIPVRGQEVGQRWVESRPISRADRLQSSTEYSLVQQGERQQTLEWAGRQTSRGTPQVDDDIEIRSLGADWHGSAGIEIGSQLCLDLLETQQSRMAVRTPTGREFTQSRTTTLRIERLPLSQADSAPTPDLFRDSPNQAARPVSRSGGPEIR